jgi:hypothetical protein
MQSEYVVCVNSCFSLRRRSRSTSNLITQIKARPWIGALFPFGLREDDPHPTNNQPGSGLLKYGAREPKAAWAVLQEGFKALS